MIPQNKTVKKPYEENAYEIWENLEGWQWFVLKKWQKNDDQEYARWFCLVKSPYVPEGELGDVYVSEIKQFAWRVK